MGTCFFCGVTHGSAIARTADVKLTVLPNGDKTPETFIAH